jgi:hypothetical protein
MYQPFSANWVILKLDNNFVPGLVDSYIYLLPNIDNNFKRDVLFTPALHRVHTAPQEWDRNSRDMEKVICVNVCWYQDIISIGFVSQSVFREATMLKF